MTQEEIKEYLKNNLKITILEDYGTITIALQLEDEVISSENIYLPVSGNL